MRLDKSQQNRYPDRSQQLQLYFSDYGVTMPTSYKVLLIGGAVAGFPTPVYRVRIEAATVIVEKLWGSQWFLSEAYAPGTWEKVWSENS